MIIGDFYVNNFLILGIIVAALGGIGYVADVPGMLDNEDSSQDISQNFEISLQGQGLNPGSSKTLQVINNQGRYVEEAEVTVNGEKVGLTDENGSLTFEVPDASNFTVSASKSDLESSKTFDIGDYSGDDDSDTEDSSGDGNRTDTGGENDTTGDTGNDNQQDQNQPVFIRKISPETSELSSRSFEAVIELGAENASYRVYLGGEQKLSGELDGNTTVSSNLKMPKNGTLGLLVEILKNENLEASQNYSMTYNSDTGDSGGDSGDDGSDGDGPQTIDIASRSPSEGETVRGTNVSFEFISSLRNAPGLGYEIKVDGTTQHSGDLSDGYNEYLRHVPIGPGEHNYVVNVVNQSNSDVVVSSDTGSFEVVSTADVNLVKPQYSSYYGKVPVMAELKVDEATDYSIKIDGNERFSGAVSSESTVEKEVNLDEGSYSLEVELIRSSQVIAEDEKTFEVDRRSVFELLHPNQTTVDDYETYFQFEVNNSALEASSYEIIIDGNVEHSGSISGEGKVRVGENEGLEVIIPDSGDHIWKVKTSGTTVNTSEPVEFSTTRSEPENINLELLAPNSGASVSGETEFSWRIDAPEGSSYKAYWSTNESLQQGPVPFDGIGGSTEYSHLYSYNSSGTYSWAVEVQNSSTGDVIDSMESELYHEG